MDDRVDYNVQEFPGYYLVHKWINGNEVRPAASYRVTRNAKGNLECSCPSGKYRGYCKHKTMVQDYQRADKDGRLGELGVFFLKG